MIIGAQLYTVRDFCGTPEALAESLKKIADIGYTTVQVSGTCPYDPAWLAQQLKANGLTCPLTHYDKARIAGDAQTVANEHTVFGADYIGVGYYELGSPEKVEEFLSTFGAAMDTFSRMGKKLMYHNHDMEFTNIDGKAMLQLLAERSDPAALGFTLDTFWVQSGGGDPAWWLHNLAGRVDCVHYKDFAYPHQMRAVGEGNLNFDAILAASHDVGVKYAFVEQDDCNGDDPFDCLKRSYNYLKACGLN